MADIPLTTEAKRKRGRLLVEEMKTESKEGIRIFSLRANGIKLQLEIPERDMNSEKRAEKVHEVNEKFKNSMRYIKHFGGFPRKGVEIPENALTSVWSTSDTGLALRPADDPIKEFEDF